MCIKHYKHPVACQFLYSVVYCRYDYQVGILKISHHNSNEQHTTTF